MKEENLKIEYLATDSIHPSPTQPRKNFDQEKQHELTESIREHGFTMSVVTVRRRPQQDGFEMVAGERRLRAAKEVGMKEIPCLVKELTDQQVLEIQLIENIVREDLSPIEEAEHYKRLLAMRDEKDKPLYTYESLGKRISRTSQTIRHRVLLCDLPAEAKREVESGRLSPETSVLIARIPDMELRLEATKLVLHPVHEAGPLSFRRATEVIHEKFIRDLRTANFDQADAILLPIETNEAGNRTAGGACLDCPFKTGVSKAAEVSREKHNICLNPSCFQRKKDLQWEKWRQSETDPQRNRIAANEAESRKLFPSGSQLAPAFGLVDLDDLPDGNDLRPGEESRLTWRQLIKGTNLQVLVSPDERGKIHELVDRQKAIEAASTINKHDIFKTTKRERPKAGEERKEEEKGKEENRELNRRALFMCIDQVKKNVTTARLADLLRLQIDREIEFSNGNAEFFKRHGLPIGGSVANQLRRRSLGEVVSILVEFVVAEGGFSYDSLHEKNAGWLKIFGVDYDKIRKRLNAEKPPPKKPTSKKKKKK
jgi:ParB/RepB/Spo0J family partition protein